MKLFDCKFCGSSFKTATLLKRHQTTVKYCLKIQEENEFICDGCEKSFTTKQYFNVHISSCKILKDKNLEKNILEKDILIKDLRKVLEEKEKLLKDRDDIIIELKAKIEIYVKDHETVREIAKQPKTQNNTINNNNKVLVLSPFSLSQMDINSIVDNKFTKEHFLCGQKGVAKFTSSNILKDIEGNPMYMCTDASRNVFTFKTKDGVIEKDIKAVKLTDTISPAVITKSEKIYNQIKDDDTSLEYMQKLRDIKKLSTDNDKFVHELTVLTANNTDLVIKDPEEESKQKVIEDLTTEEIEFIENLRKKKSDDLEKLERLKTHQNQSLYQYHLKMYNKKYGEDFYNLKI